MDLIDLPSTPTMWKMRLTTSIILVDLIAVPVGAELEAVARGVRGKHLALPRLALPSAPAPLRDLQTLEASDLIQYAICELPFWGIIAPVV